MKRIGTTLCPQCGRRVMVTRAGLMQRHGYRAAPRAGACVVSGTVAASVQPRVPAETLLESKT